MAKALRYLAVVLLTLATLVVAGVVPASAADDPICLITAASALDIGSPRVEISAAAVLDVEAAPVVVSAAPPAAPAQARRYDVVMRPGTGSITSGYGMRRHPMTGAWKMHEGIDLSTGDGNAYATLPGVVAVRWSSTGGNMVWVDHAGGVQTRYLHLARVYVAPGSRVSAGDVVGRIGATGRVTGPHLHFEVLVNGRHVNPISWLER